ncbi:type I-F CRISPR-associated protein Csy3 [Acinetobacter guerrae]|uniref:type I-F CRISPR-associated protein Csy3 n=1 Tax=Acinetobacter guerrae TaxID=1843371 RepID=UPI00125F5F4D|nr:type I-F CRISPR-associated protein Csy3 [Acinetobacter guerrae]
MTIFKKLPGSLSLQRGTVVSDGAFFNLFDEGKQEPLHVMYHGIRGTQNVAGNKEKGAATGNSLAREVTNIQLTESAKLQPEAKLLVKWDFRFIDLSYVLFASASKAGADKSEEHHFRQAFLSFVDRAKQSAGLKEVVRRYVRNIVNGRWLWRNRIVAESISIEVIAQEYPEIFKFDALSYNLKSFEDSSEHELKLVDILLQGLTGESTSAGIHIEATVDFGMGGVEVFPSQNYLEDKPKGFSRSLYQLNPVKPQRNANDNQYLGQAALRDQKIGNALRTIDTWYPLFNENDQKPIAVEPNGANLEGQIFYRVGKDKVSAFDILKEVDELDPNSEKGMFLIACLIRGGVYSEGE